MASQAPENSTPINILEVTRVSPPVESPCTEFTLPLTFFDTLLFKNTPVRRLFFYSLPVPDESTPSFFNSVIVPKLKSSLSLALGHYLPLAGRLTWLPSYPKPISIYNANDGVSLTVAESTADFSRLSRKGIRYVSELHPLVPRLESSDDHTVAAISVQITLFPDQGFTVGITADHLVQDGKSTISFIKAWAHICREGQELPPELLPSFDRTLVKDPTGLDLLYLNQCMEITGRKSIKDRYKITDLPPDQVLKTLELSKQDIEKLKEKASSEKQRRRPSTFVVTVAYAMTCLIRAKGELGRAHVVSFGFPADCRRLLDPPVASNYFGNYCVPIFMENAFAKDFMEENGFRFAVQRVSDALGRLESDPLADMDKKVTTIQGFIKVVRAGNATGLTTSGSPRFGVYKVDFGWGKPELVEIVSVDRGGVIGLAEGRDGSGGVELGLAMKKHEMERFVELFVALKP